MIIRNRPQLQERPAQLHQCEVLQSSLQEVCLQYTGPIPRLRDGGLKLQPQYITMFAFKKAPHPPGSGSMVGKQTSQECVLIRIGVVGKHWWSSTLHKSASCLGSEEPL